MAFLLENTYFLFFFRWKFEILPMILVLLKISRLRMKLMILTSKHQLNTNVMFVMQNLTIVHEGQRDHKCEICGNYFSGSQQLKKHMEAVHEGKKDHKCVICGKSFSFKKNLRRHINIVHEGKRDYKCDVCGKCYSEFRGLKYHIKNVHDIATCGK